MSLNESWYNALKEVQELAGDHRKIELLEYEKDPNVIECNGNKIYIGSNLGNSEFYDMQLFLSAHELGHMKEGLIRLIFRYFIPQIKNLNERDADRFAHEILMKKYGESTVKLIESNIIKYFYKNNINNSREKIYNSLKKLGIDAKEFNILRSELILIPKM